MLSSLLLCMVLIHFTETQHQVIYTWKAGLKITQIKLDFIKDTELLLLLENNIRG